MEEREKFLHDTIAAQRRFLVEQRAIAIRNRPPTRTQLRSQTMTYLKHVENKKHSDLKNKTFEEIQALYEKVKRAGYKEEKGGHMKMLARKRKRPQSDVDSDDEHIKCLKIVTFEGTIDSEIMERKSVITRLNKVSSPDGDYLVIYRANGNFRAFNYLLELEDGTIIHMLVERRYPLSKDLMQRMLDFGLEVKIESIVALDLIRFIKQQLNEEVLNSPCFMVKSWLVQDQTVLGKDYSNLLIADSLLKIIWFINAPCYGNEALASPKPNEQTATGKGKSNRLWLVVCQKLQSQLSWIVAEKMLLLKTCCRRIAKDVKDYKDQDQDLTKCLGLHLQELQEDNKSKET
ncbi:hypothetical protein Tco_0488450 [Tanacetum coccineum]